MPKVRMAELSFLNVTHMSWSTFLPSIIKIFQRVFDLQSGHEINGLLLSNIIKGDNAKSQKDRIICSTFLPSTIKIFQRVFQLQSRQEIYFKQNKGR